MNDPAESGYENNQGLAFLPHRLIKRIAWAGTAAMILGGMSVVLARHFFGLDIKAGQLFKLNMENNLPTWFSSTGLLACAVLLMVISIIKRKEGERWWIHWAVLAVLFTLLSIDEAASLHEKFFSPLRRSLGLTGILWYAWVIPGMIFVAAFVAAFARFLLHLPRPLAIRFIVSGAIYVSGALLMEMAGGYYRYNYGRETLTYGMLAAIEETLELIGMTLYLTSLVDYLTLRRGGLAIAFRSQKPDQT